MTGLVLSFSLFLMLSALFPSSGGARENESGAARLEVLLEEQRVEIERDRKLFNSDCGIVSSKETAKIEECRARHEDIRRRMGKYNADLDAFLQRRAAIEEIESQLAVIDRRIVTTRKEIERYADQARLKEYQASLIEWAKLPDAARGEARRAAIEGLLSLAIDLGSLRVEEKMELTREAIENLAGKNYQKFLSDLERHASRVLRKEISMDLDTLRNKAMLLNVANTFKDGMSGVKYLEVRDREEYLNLSLKLIGIVNSTMIRNPGIDLLILDGEVVPAAAYGWLAGFHAKERIHQLVQVGEDRLKGLNAVSTLYKKDIDKRKGLLQARDNILKEASAR